MTSFYKNLNSNSAGMKSKNAAALRKAAVLMIKDERFRHPFFWAGFVLIGIDAAP